MKYLTLFVISMTALLFVACSTGGGEATVIPEATETIPVLKTAVPTEAPAATDEAYPVADPTQEPVDAYPGEAPTVAPSDPYPGQEPEPTPEIDTDSAYPADGSLSDDDSGILGDSTAVVQQVSQDLAARLGIDESEITVVGVEIVEWSDSSLGCPAPGYAYAQVITPGFQIILESGAQQYDYHTDSNGNFVLCGEDGQPVE